MPGWAEWSSEHPLEQRAPEQRAMEQMLIGVSTRKCGRSLETLPAAVEAAHGQERGEPAFSAGDGDKVTQLLERCLAQPDLKVPLLDCVHFTSERPMSTAEGTLPI